VNRAPDSRLEDQLGPLEPPYRSRGEAQVGRLLDRYGIPFSYEQPAIVYAAGRHRVWHPDFTLPTYADLLVEYAGMPDRPEYLAGLRYKQRVYAANDIPVLFVYPNDLTGSRWPRCLAARIRAAGERNLERRGYSAFVPARNYR
jgi:hypothetical protein